MKLHHSIEQAKRTKGHHAWTMLEIMIVLTVASLILAGALSTMTFMHRTLDGTANYAELDRQSRNALDQMTRDIRMCGGLTNCSPTALYFTNKDGTQLSYVWNTNTGRLVCSNYASGETLSNLLLKGCTYLKFSVFQRTPVTNTTMTFTPITVPDPTNFNTVKVIVMDWICKKTNYTTLTDSESVQTAKVVLRN
ncbi:MAG: hypothetical protein JWQ71_1937 [Pedosphaera sp.]|nr:hypothetical protein [Pedosphaera sp.]